MALRSYVFLSTIHRLPSSALMLLFRKLSPLRAFPIVVSCGAARSKVEVWCEFLPISILDMVDHEVISHTNIFNRLAISRRLQRTRRDTSLPRNEAVRGQQSNDLICI